MPPPDLTRRALLGSAAAIATGTVLGPRWSVAGMSDPTSADWKALRKSIDGNVIRQGQNGYGAAYKLFNPRFDPRKPEAVVQCASSGDVREAIAFAQKYGLKCRPKAGGHSYVGASAIKGGMVIDTSLLDKVKYHSGDRTAVVGAGALLYDAHKKLDKDGRTIPTGTCPTVGAAGLTLGGGLGVASRQFGLSCDQVTGLTIVTADGKIRKIDRQHDKNLFWACRGGGGGNFGIVTRFEFTTQKAKPMGIFSMTFPWSSASDVIRGFAKRLEKMPRSSWANLRLEANGKGGADLEILGVCAAGDQDKEAHAMEKAAGVNASTVSTFQRSFMGGIEFLGGGTTSARTNFAAGSDIFAKMPKDLADLLPKLVKRHSKDGGEGTIILDPLTGAVQDVGQGASAFPWRNHLCDVQIYIGLPTSASQNAVQAAYDWIDTVHKKVRSYSAGGYVNYLEPNRSVASYYGPNYARLKKVKASYDPDSFFVSPFTVH